MHPIPNPELADIINQEDKDMAHQPLELYFTFKNQEDRDKAKSLIYDVRQHNELFLSLTALKDDPHPSHAGDGLALYFDRYDNNLVHKIKNFFQSHSLEVVAHNEFVITPDVEEARAKQLMEDRRLFEVAHQEPASKVKKDNLREMPLKNPREEIQEPAPKTYFDSIPEISEDEKPWLRPLDRPGQEKKTAGEKGKDNLREMPAPPKPKKAAA